MKQLLPRPCTLQWTSEVLTAFERAMELAEQPEVVVKATEAGSARRRDSESRLRTKTQLPAMIGSRIPERLRTPAWKPFWKARARR